MTKKEQRRQDWIARIAEYKDSGQTMKAWCSAQGVTLDQLKYWLRKLKSHPARSVPKVPASFVPLSLNEPSVLPASPSLPLYVGSVRIEVNVGFDPRLLRDVVTALVASC
jgi:hypothetical protein